MAVLAKVALEAVKITALVLLMMVAVDALNVVSRGRLKTLAQGGRWRQYVGAALLGALPGCLGSFAAVSLYVHGMLSFGALAGNMIATSGDEAFVMLAMFPRAALGLFALLFILGIGFAWLTDRLLPALRFRPCADCRLDVLHPEEAGLRHYLREHVWNHLLRKHLGRVFLWTFGALAVVEIGLKHGNLEPFVTQHAGWMLLLAAVAGIIPESGPHLIFVTLFAKGLVPFSVLFVSSFVQDGHGLLPLLSYSWRDTLALKAFSLVFGLSLGALLYALGG
jgi:hypothetical protein